MTRHWPLVLSIGMASGSGCLIPESAYKPYWSSDVDGDGVPSSEDCAPKDSDAYAGAMEICGDSVAQDCDSAAGWPPEECVWSGKRALFEDGVAWTGEDEGDQAGYAVAGVGDVTGDGREDLLISAMQPYISDGEGGTREQIGRAYLVSGDVAAQGGELRDATTRWVGRSGEDALGAALGALGDANGSELPYIVIGAPYYGDESLYTRYAGAVYVVPNDNGSFEAGNLDSEEQVGAIRWVGELDGGTAGQALASFVDDEERGPAPFLVIGAPLASSEDEDNGRVYLMHGEDAVVDGGALSCGSWCLEGAKDDQIGFAVDAADLTGDGVHELLIGAPDSDTVGMDAGALYIVDRASEVSSPADSIMWTGRVGEGAGCMVAGIGDLDGDGDGEVVVGAMATNLPEARFYVLSGSTLMKRSETLEAADAIWSQDSDEEIETLSAARAGDVDGDGQDDLVLGAPYENDLGQSSTTYVLSGANALAGGSLSRATAYWAGAVPGDQAGYSVAGIGDLDDDGLADLLVGALGSGAGSAWLLLSPGL